MPLPSRSRTEPVVRTEGLSRAYRNGRRGTVRALDGLDLEIGPGEIFGFLGPNGAGKTTTLRLLTGLIRPTSGRGFLLGRPLGDPQARARIGFLPENPSFYDHLSLREFLRLCGALFGLGGRPLSARIDALIERLGLVREADRPMRRLSKGQAQRAGIAQSLVNEPAVLFLDEPMSGLDPIGRAEIRDVLLELNARGTTVFFSSHILPDVESICDRVGIIESGRLRKIGCVDDLLATATHGYDIAAAGIATGAVLGALPGVTARPAGDRVLLSVSEPGGLNEVLARVIAAGGRIESVTPRRQTLEEFFLREVGAAARSAATDAPADRTPRDAEAAGARTARAATGDEAATAWRKAS